MSLPLAVVIDQLKSAPASVIPILSSLHKAKATFSSVSKVDLKHLTGRTLTLCRSNDTYSVWCGVNIIYVLTDSSEIVGAEGSAFFAQLLKVLGSTHARNKKVLESAIECLRKLCDSIRGKPTLTREILTPNLSSVFGVLLEKLEQSPWLVLSSLKKLIQEHPTTSRPFANKLKTHILRFIMEDQFLSYPQALRAEACSTLACLPVIEKDAPEQHWLRDVNTIISEITNTVEIYASFLNVKDDQEASSLLKTLGKSEEEGIFPLLNIDINYPSTIFAISQRTSMLFELLQGYLLTGTKFTVVVPIGKVLSLVDLVCSLNTRFISFKREIREAQVKEYVDLSLTRCHTAALALLRQLPAKFSASLLPHFSAVLATLELLVFLQNKRLDHAKILANEPMLCEVITCTTNFLALTSYFADHSLISRIIEAAVFLVQPRAGSQQGVNEAEKVKLSNQSKSARKKAKRNAAVPLSDLISHEHLFQQTIPDSTRKTILEFFAHVIRRVPISSTHYNKILKFVIIEAVKLSDSLMYNHVSEELKQVLIAALLNPAPESASIFPIATAILPQSDTLGVLNSPRFPPLPVIVKNSVDMDDEEDEDEDDEEPQQKEQVIEQAQKRFKANPASDAHKKESTATESQNKSTQKTAEADIFTSKPFKSLEENKQDIAEVKAENQALDQEAVAQNNEAVNEISEQIDEEMESDGGSEIEIPDLDLEDDSDEEK